MLFMLEFPVDDASATSSSSNGMSVVCPYVPALAGLVCTGLEVYTYLRLLTGGVKDEMLPVCLSA